MTLRLDAAEPGFEARFAAFVAARREEEADVRESVAAILRDVRTGGDAALLAHTRRLDRFDVADAAMLRVDPDDMARAAKAAEREGLYGALAFAAERIRAFHERQRPEDDEVVDGLGVRMGLRWRPIDAVGLYVPGGLAAYPSSLLMNAIPARVAGCKRLVVAVPAPAGRVGPLVLAAAHLAGVDEVWRIGGAQAVAALAYGTETIAPVDKVVGPGNAYVAEAKRQVFGRIGIDMVAGPSEIVVLADALNDPEWIAADLLSQAEHDAQAQAVLVTDDAAFAKAVSKAVGRQIVTLERADIARASWEAHGALVVVGSLFDAVPLIDRLAPEHLEIAVDDPDALASRIRHAGSIFLGRHTPEVIGDYVGGPNHVLPTGRSARFASGLGVLDFMKRTTLLACGAEALAALAPAARLLAEAEGLGAHARAVAVRTNAAP
ncbi:MAG: histidinol dehydrogenase [Geminicoccaceae bacterium]|nr:histidinol dehydrogenase [Geminicoccaceae bacterium]